MHTGKRLGIVVIATAVAIQLAASTAFAQAPDCQGTADVPRVREVLTHLETLRSAPTAAWGTYRPDSATYVFLVNRPEGAPCALIWRAGKANVVIALSAPPRLSTPMYGFHGPAGSKGGPESDRWTQPSDVAQQLDALGVQRAVLVPIVPEIKLPFELRALNLFDIAVHEAFHLHVQAPSWVGVPSEYRWPRWTAETVDRRDLVTRCYGSDGSLVSGERQHLVEAAMAALTGGSTTTVCTNARAFVDARKKRLETVDAAAKADLSCRSAEAIMELNEGVPDFVFWTTARQLGIVNDERVRQRFTAAQRDVFYLTGAMQLVVLRSLAGDERFRHLIDQIAASDSRQAGELFSAFEAELTARCPR